LDEVTLEAWVTSAFTGFYPRIFDFGSQANNIYGWGASYFYLTPSGQDRNGQPTVAAVVSTNRIIESPYLYIPSQLSPGQETHFAVTYSPSQNVSKLYTNGVLATSGPAPTSLSLIVDTNNWLGRSQFTDDDYFKGSYNEFRMYRTALSDSEVAASYAAGPDVIGIDFILRQRIDGENLTLCWGPDASSLVLQTCSTVASDAAWTNVSVTPVFTNGQYEAIIPLTKGPQFFRLGPP
jgi:hypothetical protein